MTVRTRILAPLALAATLAIAGCDAGGSATYSAETDDPLYREGMELAKQGRKPQALTDFLKVIERRGSQPSPESNLEAGLIYLQDIKDPNEAIHYLKKYLEQQPHPRDGDLVRQRIEDARREFGRTLPGRPLDDQSARLEMADQIKQLQQENDELRAQLGRSRSGGMDTGLRVMQGAIQPVEPNNPAMRAASRTPPIPAADLLRPAPTPPPAGGSGATQTLASPTRSQPGFGLPPGTPAPQPATPSRPGRTYTVAEHDTLYKISRKYNVKVEDLVAANRETIPTVSSPLRPGAVLKIP